MCAVRIVGAEIGPEFPEARCALTVDVEDWYQSAVDPSAPLSTRVVDNTQRVLSFLDGAQVKATFFVLGEVARRFPAIVQEIVRGGHEVQCHGDRHVSLTTLVPYSLRAMLERARKSVEDTAGVRVTAFRAPYFSIGTSNLWALEAVAEAGFRVDSSVFPAAMPRYGVAGWPTSPHWHSLKGDSILEAPVAVWETAGWRLPVGGGGYLRALPLSVVLRAYRSMLARKIPVVLYCHPYEFNPWETDEYVGQVPWSTRVSQGLGRASAMARLREVLRCLPFGTLGEVLQGWLSNAPERSQSTATSEPIPIRRRQVRASRETPTRPAYVPA